MGKLTKIMMSRPYKLLLYRVLPPCYVPATGLAWHAYAQGRGDWWLYAGLFLAGSSVFLWLSGDLVLDTPNTP